MKIKDEILHFKERFLHVFFVFFDDFQMSFVFLILAERPISINKDCYKINVELYSQKISEIFNHLITENLFHKLSQTFKNFKESKSLLAVNFYERSLKFCLLFIDNFNEFPEESMISHQFFSLFLMNVIELVNLPKSPKIGNFIKLQKENNKYEDLSFLCSVFPEDFPRIFKGKEEPLKKLDEKKEKIMFEGEREFKINKKLSLVMKFYLKDERFLLNFNKLDNL